MKTIEEVIKILNMDANYFYSTCISFVSMLISAIEIIFRIIKNKTQSYKAWNSQCVKVGEDFYVIVMAIEFAYMFAGTLIMCLIRYFMEHRCNNMKFVNALTMIIGVFLIAVSIKSISRRVYIRKKFINDVKKKIILYIPVVFAYIIICMIIMGYRNIYINLIYYAFLITMEIIGLTTFRGATQYKYKSVRFYLNTGNVLNCEDISKINRKNNILIIDGKNKQIRIKYENISYIEYYGEMIVKMNGKG